MIDGERGSPGTAVHLDTVLQSPVDRVVLEMREMLPDNVMFVHCDFSGFHHGIVKTFRRLISERLVYDEHKLFGQLVEPEVSGERDR